MTFGIWAMFLSIADYCWRERAAVVRYGGVPFLIVTITSILAPTPTKESGAAEWTAAALIALIQSLCYLPVTVAWYRKVVLGDSGVSGRPVFTLGHREWRLLLWQIALLAIGLALLAVAVGVVAGLYYAFIGVGQAMAYTACAIAIVVLFAAWFAILNRLGMVLVLAATDQPVAFGAAWDLTRGLTWPLLGTLGLLIVASIVGGLAVAVVGTVAALVSELFAMGMKAVLGAGVGLVTLVACATLFGFAYLRIMQARGAVPGAAAS